ncbi:MAG: hypothetical protein ACREOC_03450 [Gemmatimonadales bacterium]
MPTKLFAGRLASFDAEDSMARSIESALATLLGPLPSAPPNLVDDRRKLFIAIARGVINHLESREAALRIEFNVGFFHVSTHPNIDVDHTV